MDDFLRKGARSLVALIAQHKSRVGLVIAEARISRWGQHAGIRHSSLSKRIAQFLCENCLERLHWETVAASLCQAWR